MNFMSTYPERIKKNGEGKTLMAEKILHGMIKAGLIDGIGFSKYLSILNKKKKIDHSFFDILNESYKGKIHTIRKSVKAKKGEDIVFKDEEGLIFAPVMECVCIQEITFFRSITGGVTIIIDERQIGLNEARELSSNSGFDKVSQMLEYFNESDKMYIHHWTNYKYGFNHIEVKGFQVVKNY